MGSSASNTSHPENKNVKKQVIGKITFSGMEIGDVTMNVSESSLDQGDSSGSKIVVLKNGEKFIEPDINELVPGLYEHCKHPNQFLNPSNYSHCNQLYRMMFRHANHNNQNPHFRSLFSPDKDNKLPDENEKDLIEKCERKVVNENKDTDLITHHVSHLMKGRKGTEIIQTCDDFKAVCDDFLHNTHPLSKKLMEEPTVTASTDPAMAHGQSLTLIPGVGRDLGSSSK